MSALTWDQSGERDYHVGIHKVALYVADSAAASGYATGVAWNGVTKITDSPSGAEATDLWANDTKYGTLRSSEQFGGTIEAYMSPEEFDECDGCREVAPGVLIRQQNRKAFGLVYVETLGNDTDGMDHGEILHIVYNATASPSSVDHSTVNESPDVGTLSWEFSTTPVAVEGYKPTSHFEFRSNEMGTENWNKLLGMVFGSQSGDPTLPTPATILSEFATVYTYTKLTSEPSDWSTAYYTKYYTKYDDTYTLIPRQDTAPEFDSDHFYSRSAS